MRFSSIECLINKTKKIIYQCTQHCLTNHIAWSCNPRRVGSDTDGYYRYQTHKHGRHYNTPHEHTDRPVYQYRTSSCNVSQRATFY